MKYLIVLGVMAVVFMGTAGMIGIEGQGAIELRPKASLLSPVVNSNDTQQIFLTVRDQNYNPIQGAVSMVTVHLPNGDQSLLMPSTDDNGVSRLELRIVDQPPGSCVLLEFWIVYQEVQATTRDAFRIWW